MMRNVFVFIGGLFLLIAGAWVLFTFVLITDEDRVHRLIQKCKQGFESGSVLSITGVFAPDYTDRSGADKAVVIRVLQSLFDATSSRLLQFSSIEVDISENSAQAQMICTLNFQPTPGSAMVIPRIAELNGKRLRMEIELVKIKQRWKVVHTDWKRIH